MNDFKDRHFDTVCIIGNGFDLNLGLETGYNHFLKSKQFVDIIPKSWIAQNLKDRENLKNWIDIELELVRLSNKEKPKDYYSFKEDFQTLSKALVWYLSSLDIDFLGDVLQSNAFKLINAIADKNALIIDFNYTDSLSGLTFLFGGAQVNFMPLKIHGSSKDDNIIFGVHDKAELKPGDSFLKKSVNRNYNPINFSKKILECKNLLIFGHSLGDTDEMYFSQFFIDACEKQSKKNRNIFIFYYKDLGYDNLFEQIDKLTERNISNLKMNNNVETFDVSKNIDFEKIRLRLNGGGFKVLSV